MAAWRGSDMPHWWRYVPLMPVHEMFCVVAGGCGSNVAAKNSDSSVAYLWRALVARKNDNIAPAYRYQTARQPQ